ncbi:hypothetical protein ADIARSV_0170 [Arcticibacter svalbardensis MN12-7]|uniref:Uncharacterized protein n=1 Tax=Arcticibacter svalbardensis MN12-7 TaxID=1150600 RepID=R9GYT1_9SPHI|nr:hypothetical protein ADIARSV_0170 [Arcticibacter svalbardensis MN12-7]
MIGKVRKAKSVAFLDSPKTVSLSAPKRELKELIDVFTPRIDLSLLPGETKEVKT